MTVTKLVNNAKTLSDKLVYLYLDKFDVQNEYNWLNLTTPMTLFSIGYYYLFCMTKNNNQFGNNK